MLYLKKIFNFTFTKMRNAPLALLLSYAAVEFVLMFVRHVLNDWGWDHQVYCRAFELLKIGGNPYLVENLGTKLSYTYPPLAAYMFAPLCSLPFFSYLGFQFLTILVLCWLLVRYLKFDIIRTLLFVAFGFNASKSNLMTGNLGLLEALAFVIFLVLNLPPHSRWSWASNLGFGLMGYIKILPALFNLLSVFGNKIKDFRKTLIQVGTSAILFLTLWGATWIYSKEYSLQFFSQLLGKHGNQHNALAESQANPSNPTLILWFKNINDNFLKESSAIFICCLVFLLILSALVFYRRILRESDLVVKYAWLAWILVLWLPRYKEYSFVYSSVILLVLVERKFPRWWLPILLITIFQRSLAGTYDQIWRNLLLNNAQTITHFLLFIVLGLGLEFGRSNQSDQIQNKTR